MDPAPRPELRERIAALLDRDPTRFRRVEGGYTPAERWQVICADGRSAFAKVGIDAGTSEALRREAAIYGVLRGRFMPEFLGWQDDASAPLLLIEDLSGARWPPPWDEALIGEVRRSLDELHASSADLPPFATQAPVPARDWPGVAEDPEPFLSLGLASRSWLEEALPALISASESTPAAGDSIVHLDVRSDNLCLTARGVVLIDWNCTRLGHAPLDLGFWLPSLEIEGGPAPEEILADEPGVAATVSGFFAARAGLPVIPHAPRVRWIQTAQLKSALPWAARALGLAVPTGP